MFDSTTLFEIACTTHGGIHAVQRKEDALVFCERLAKEHYENFPVASYVLPSHIRNHIIVIYAFSRIADDIADEYAISNGIEKAESALTIMHHFCKLAQQGQFKGTNPLWIGMQRMFDRTKLPIEPFERLLTAFSSDIHFTIPSTMQKVVEYCEHSANPIGEIILRLHGNWNSNIQPYSDALCTALQLTNFLQDISIDRLKGRIYLPLDTFEDSALVENYLANEEISPNFSMPLHHMLSVANSLFVQSKNISHLIYDKRLRIEIALIHISGNVMFQKCVKSSAILIQQRLTLSVSDYVIIMIRLIIQLPTLLMKR